MDVMKLIEYLQEIVDTSYKVPIVGKTVVKKKELSEVIDKIIESIPEELKKAKWICEERERILRDAHRQAEQVRKESYAMLKKEIENHDITKEAKIKAEEIITSANRDAKMIRIGAREYADEVLSGVERELATLGDEMVMDIKKRTEEHLSSMEKSVNTTSGIIKQNIEELRNNIK